MLSKVLTYIKSNPLSTLLLAFVASLFFIVYGSLFGVLDNELADAAKHSTNFDALIGTICTGVFWTSAILIYRDTLPFKANNFGKAALLFVSFAVSVCAYAGWFIAI